MNHKRREVLRYAGAMALAAPWASRALAAADVKSWPDQPVKLIVPNVPGGGIDILGRLLQAELTKLWGQPVVIEYKPGANTVIGTDAVARSDPDGYTLGMVVTSHVINPSLRHNMPFDTVKDLAGVCMTATSGILLSCSPKLPFNTLPEFIAYAKANKGKVTYASPGAGSAMHLAGERLKLEAGIDMLHVAYKGSGGAYVDVMDGRVDAIIDPLFASLPHVKGGKLKPLAVTSALRDPTLPNVPPIAETLPGFDVRSINGIVVPAATKRPLVHKIAEGFQTVLKSEGLKKRLLDVGLDPVASSPEEFDAYVRKEIAEWGQIVKVAHVSIE